MTAFIQTPAEALGAPVQAAAKSLARRIAAALAAPFVAIAREARIRRSASMLQELDDRTLADIGLRRTQILATATQVIDWPHVDPRRVAR